MADMDLPPRMVAVGEQPVGDRNSRITVYKKMEIIPTIVDALEESELEFLRKSPFGKLLDLPSKPAFSGSFGLFLLARQLEVKKENEIWVVFAGAPVRFSLREFKIVTRLPCGKYPSVKKAKRKGTAGVRVPYYGTLFGMEEKVSVERVLSLLQDKSITDSRMRLQYACLALVDGIVVPTNHYPKVKIQSDHAELVKDLDEFLKYPWGRLSFDRLMSAIKERDLSQILTSSVAVQGLFQALQLVVLEAVPAIQDGPAPCTVEDSDEDKVFVPPIRPLILADSKRVPLKLNQAKDLDEACEVQVESIICPEIDDFSDGEDLVWTDEEEDSRVDNMVRLVKEGFKFENEMFVGGLKASELVGKKIKRRSGSNVRPGRGGKCVSKPPPMKRCRRSRKPVGGVGRVQNVTDSSSADSIDIKLAQMFAMFEGKVADIVQLKLEENNRKNNKEILEGVIKWFNENIIFRPGEKVEVSDKSVGDSDASNPGDPSPHPNPTPSPTQTNGHSSIYDNRDVSDWSNDPSAAVAAVAVFYSSDSILGGDKCAENINLNEDEDEEDKTGDILDGGCHTSPTCKSVVGESADLSPPREIASVKQSVVNGEGDFVEEPVGAIDGVALRTRASKRARAVPSRYDDYYVCEKKRKILLAQVFESGDSCGSTVEARFTKAMKALKRSFKVGNSIQLSVKDISDMVERQKPLGSKLMDGLIQLSRHVFRADEINRKKHRVEFMDSNFVAQLTRLNAKFLKTPNSAEFVFPTSLVEEVIGNGDPQRREFFKDVDFVYAPFNFDKKHWVALVIDLKADEILVLDCNIHLRAEASILKEIQPLGLMLPYLVRQTAANPEMGGISTSPFIVERVVGIPQAHSLSDSGVMSILLL